MVGARISGRLELAEQAHISAEVGGEVRRVGPEAGESVEAGKLLVEIDPAAAAETVESARAAVESATEALELAKSAQKRSEYLVQQGAQAPVELDAANNQVAAARAQLEQARSGLAGAQETLGRSTIRAPMDGVVSLRQVDPGDIVAPGAPLFTLVDPQSARFEATAPSDAAGALIPGARVEFEVRGYPGRQFYGVLEQVIPQTDARTGQIPLIVQISASQREGVSALGESQALLFGGLFAQGRIIAEQADGLILPLEALELSADDDERASALLIREGEVREVTVELGLVDQESGRAQIRSGLSAGDPVLSGVARRQVEPGTPVMMPKEAAPASGEPASERPIGGGPPNNER